MARIGYLYFFGCWCVFAGYGKDERIIGKTRDKEEAIQWMNDYNELHRQ